MKYFETTFHIVPNSEVASDILSALLADVSFEAFEPTADGLTAWIQQQNFVSEDVDAIISTFPLPDTDISYSIADAPDENWNLQWEQEGFSPIVISDERHPEPEPLIVIHDTSHPDVPQAVYDITINPCQAFGTGSHDTTRMILRQLYAMPMKGRHVIDAGTGTGILSIFCRMRGAESVFAYDIDEWSVRNAQYNLQLNGVQHGVEVLLGDSRVLSGHGLPIAEASSSALQTALPSLLIANINRNILVADMPVFASCLTSGDELLLSGFYTEDVPILLQEAAKYSFAPVLQAESNNWALLLLKKDKSS